MSFAIIPVEKENICDEDKENEEFVASAFVDGTKNANQFWRGICTWQVDYVRVPISLHRNPTQMSHE
jgi:hypothetical protein